MGCQVGALLAPIVVPAVLLLALVFFGAFGGKVGKLIAIVGFLVWFLWFIGLEWAGIPLPAFRTLFILAAMPAVPDPFELHRWRESRKSRGVRDGRS